MGIADELQKEKLKFYKSMNEMVPLAQGFLEAAASFYERKNEKAEQEVKQAKESAKQAQKKKVDTAVKITKELLDKRAREIDEEEDSAADAYAPPEKKRCGNYKGRNLGQKNLKQAGGKGDKTTCKKRGGKGK